MIIVCGNLEEEVVYIVLNLFNCDVEFVFFICIIVILESKKGMIIVGIIG